MSKPEFKARLSLRADISPSEDPAKVSQAMRDVVGEVGPESVREEAGYLTTDDPEALSRLRDQLRDRHVRSAARRQMLLNVTRDSTSLMINRQAAAAGVVALCGSPAESPLGPIYLTIKASKIQSVIDWLTAYPG